MTDSTSDALQCIAAGTTRASPRFTPMAPRRKPRPGSGRSPSAANSTVRPYNGAASRRYQPALGRKAAQIRALAVLALRAEVKR